MNKHTSAVPMQLPATDVWSSKYQLKDAEGNAVDNSIEESNRRVAKAIAQLEERPEEWEELFFETLQNGAVCGGRIMSNAGAEEHKPAVSVINCTVSDTIHDSMEGILTANLKAGLTLKAGCGIGYDFSTIRPNGAVVKGAGATTNGSIAFMQIFDKMCHTVSSAGGRRGAQMATMSISHPDIEEYIVAKRTDGNLRQFNMSILVTDEFIEAVRQDEEWNLIFPALNKAEAESDTAVLAYWPEAKNSSYFKDEATGKVFCRVYKTVSARKLWKMIMESTYNHAEPGILMIDRINAENNNWFCEDIRATNPCGEQPLPPKGACLLGSVNLTQFVKNPFTERAEFDWDMYEKTVRVFTRMLDNVVEMNGLPLEEQRQEIENKRRHGMGYIGLGSAMAMLGFAYGDDKSIAFTDRVTREMAIWGFEEGVKLAKEKGSAPVLETTFTVTPEMHSKNEYIRDNYPVGTKLIGAELLVASKYMQRLATVAPDLIKDIRKHGCRFTHHTSIAPTGTISLSFGNNASNGIEPSFAHSYTRNMIKPGRKTKEAVEVASFELLAYRHFIDKDATPSSLPANCVTSDDIKPIDHLKVQAAAQKWVDSAISKTVNVPTETEFGNFEDIYLAAHAMGLKGCTTFRFNPEAFQGVLAKKEDLEKSVYKFNLENGQVVEAAGNDIIDYDGEQMTAANLYDALKEGTYGSY